MYQMTWLGLRKQIDEDELFRLLGEWGKSDPLAIKQRIDSGKAYRTGIATITKVYLVGCDAQ